MTLTPKLVSTAHRYSQPPFSVGPQRHIKPSPPAFKCANTQTPCANNTSTPVLGAARLAGGRTERFWNPDEYPCYVWAGSKQQAEKEDNLHHHNHAISQKNSTECHCARTHYPVPPSHCPYNAKNHTPDRTAIVYTHVGSRHIKPYKYPKSSAL
jgi:hypothetical protein